MQSSLLRIGTRGSPLALAQAEQTRALITAAGHWDVNAITIMPIRTSGDRITGPLSEFGGKGLFTKEIDEALLDGRIDLAVHSAKDLPTRLPEGLAIAACLQREDVRDAFLSPVARTLADLRPGAVLGTSSLRRRALALRARPDLKIVDMRGNVETRLRKLADGIADATLLANAGLRRLGLSDRAASLIEIADWLPAPGQGAIAITTRTDDAATRALLTDIDHAETTVALTAERAFLAMLDGSCRTPIGAYARMHDGGLVLNGIIVRPDGQVAHAVERRGAIAEAADLGAEAGSELARRGGPGFFRAG